MTEIAASADPFASANDKIREAAKWLLAAAAAVGAAMIAGSQLSGVGKLEACWGTSSACLRLPVSVVGATLALVAVVFIVWTAVLLLMPKGVPLDDLQRRWGADDGADVKFFKANPTYLGYPQPKDLEGARKNSWQMLVKAREDLEAATDDDARTRAQELVDQRAARFQDMQQRVLTVTNTAQHELLRADFGALLRRLLPATALAAVGIVAFAWGSNPPDPAPATVNLREANLSGSDLSGVKLDGADLTGADLRDSDLSGASLGSRPQEWCSSSRGALRVRATMP